MIKHMLTSGNYINEGDNVIPDDVILIVPHSLNGDGAYKETICDLRGNPKRDWFNSHFYYCLPLTIGNQYGFAIRSMYDIKAIWHGGENFESLEFSLDQEPDGNIQSVVSSFGSGIITIQNGYTLRTPPGINLMTMQVPNYFIPNVMAMTGVIESDNLRRDFTFNLKITEIGKEVHIKKGDLLAAFMPIPRHFIDKFKLELVNDIFSQETINKEMQDRSEFDRQRNGKDKEKPHQSGRKYFNGEHAFGEKYLYHQKKLDRGLSQSE